MAAQPKQGVAQEKAIGAEGPSQIKAPTVSLPKGGGAIRGMGEKFAANPVTGTGSIRGREYAKRKCNEVSKGNL